MPLYDYQLKDGRTVTLYRPAKDSDAPVTRRMLADNGYPDQPADTTVEAVRVRVPARIALAQFRDDPLSQKNQVLRGYRAQEDKGRRSGHFTVEQIKRAWSDDRPQEPAEEPRMEAVEATLP